jgi:murein DD-endopeptidase MepM/ murein hydrolase activator NlpD
VIAPRWSRKARSACLETSFALALIAVTACGASEPAAAPSTEASGTTATAVSSPTPSPTTAPTPKPRRTPSPSDKPDPRWRFYTTDLAWHTSPWFAGRHRVMIGYGCNASPWYSHDSRCPGRQGFHHGIDVAMPCGTPLYAAVAGEVLDPAAPGAPGSAYGVHPFRIRSGDHDILIGHTVHVFVHPGQRVRVGQRIALAGDSGAPDGCHLHFEVRRAGGGLGTATDPSGLLALS